MSIPGEDVEFCPSRAGLHWSQAQYDHVQFADFNSVQVAKYGDVKYFQPSESDDDNEPEVDREGECLCCCVYSWCCVSAKISLVADGLM